MIVYLIAFFMYLFYQYYLSVSHQDHSKQLLVDAIIKENIKNGKISLLAAMKDILEESKASSESTPLKVEKTKKRKGMKGERDQLS